MQQNIRNSLVLVMLLTLQWSYATDFLQKVKFFGVEQGLSNQTVHSIHQGSDGFIWIGTSNGLNRYDGYNFQQWTKNNSDLSFSNIKKILEDDAGNLWLFDLIDDPYHYKLKAINLFSLEDNKIVLAPKNLPFPVEQVAHFFKDAVGNIWFYTQQAKLWKYHSTKGFTQHQIPKNFQPRYTDDGSNWWGIRQNQFLRISGEQKQVLIEQLGTYKELNFAIQDQSQQLWLSLSENRASDKRVYAIKDTLVKSLTDELYAKELWGRGSFAVATIEESFNQSIVLGFGTDLVLMDLKTKEILYTLKQSIFGEATQIQAIQKDYKGNIWIGTTVGLFLLNIHKNPFRTIQPKSDFSAYRTFGCRALIRSGEALLVQSDVGRFSWNLKTNQFQQLEDSYSYSDNKILCYTLHRGSTGKIWMSSDLLAEIDSSKGNILNIYQPDNQDTILDRSWSIYEDRNERLWLNLNSALYTFDQKNNRFEDYTFESSNRPIPQRKWQIYQIQKDEVGLLWLASNKGLYALNPEKKHLVCYWSEGEGQYYLPANDIYHFHIDQAGVFWLATANSGLIRWNPKASEGEASIRQLTSANGLSSNTLCAVYEDEREQLWISSFRGIMQIDKNTFQCKKYLIRDGIADLEYNRLAHHQDAQGNIYFGGLTGITAFHPKNFSAAPYDAALVVSTYKQYQSNLEVDTLLDLTTDFRQKGKIELFPNSLFFTLDFSLQDYFYNEETTYQYKIEQFHRDWIELNTNRLEIAGLPWGEHILKVKAKGADGRFSIQELSIPIVVHVPLLLKPWMLLFYTLALIFVVWFFVQLKNRRLHLQSQQLRLMVKERTQKIEQQAQHLKALNEQQSRFFANISHELRTPLTLILSPANKLSQQNYSKEQQQYYGKFIQENAQTLLHRINDLLALSKLDADQLKLQIETAELGNFLQRVIANIDSYALQKGLTLELNYLIQHPLYLKLDLQKINQILINFLTNSIKFTDSGGKINLTALEQEQSIQLSVSDTGIGLAPEDLARIFDRFYQAERDAYHQGTGIGLALCKELANLMDGEIWAESKLGEGSIFYFRFPKREVAKEQIAIEPIKNKTTNAFKVLPRITEYTILLVEDNTRLRQFISSELQEYKVLEAEHGEQALSFLEQQKVDLIISDIMMPKMDGFQLLKKLKANPQFQHLPVIMLTARNYKKDRLAALRIGVDDYLLKPFDTDELNARIYNLLLRYETRNELTKITLQQSSAENFKTIPPHWLQELEQFILTSLNDSRLSVEWLAEQQFVSKRQLQRRVKKATGMTVFEYIRELRFHQARQLLENRKYQTIGEVIHHIGMKDTTYFSNLYFERFGKRPIDYFN